MKPARIACAFLIAALSALGGCGQKGPLTLAREPEPEPTTAAQDQDTEDDEPERDGPGDR